MLPTVLGSLFLVSPCPHMPRHRLCPFENLPWRPRGIAKGFRTSALRVFGHEVKSPGSCICRMQSWQLYCLWSLALQVISSFLMAKCEHQKVGPTKGEHHNCLPAALSSIFPWIRLYSFWFLETNVTAETSHIQLAWDVWLLGTKGLAREISGNCVIIAHLGSLGRRESVVWVGLQQNFQWVLLSAENTVFSILYVCLTLIFSKEPHFANLLMFWGHTQLYWEISGSVLGIEDKSNS